MKQFMDENFLLDTKTAQDLSTIMRLKCQLSIITATSSLRW